MDGPKTLALIVSVWQAYSTPTFAAMAFIHLSATLNKKAENNDKWWIENIQVLKHKDFI